MSKYAKGLKAWGICQRSGKRVLLKDLVRDGHYPELLVAPEWWEPRHPQEFPPPMDEAVALYRPSPEEGMDIPADYVPDPGDPDPEVVYSCTTHLVGTAQPGETTFAIEGITDWIAGDPIYIHMDSGEWFAGQAELDGGTLYITTLQEIPGLASSGACVYIDTLGTGFPTLALAWDQLDLTESLSTGDDSSIVSVTASLGFAPYVSYSYELTGVDAELFAINTDGALDTAVSLDLTDVPGGTYDLTLTATVTDSAGGTATADLPVEITVAPLVVEITEDVVEDECTDFTLTVQELSVGGYGYELDNAGTIDPDPAEWEGGRIIMIAAYVDGVEMYITNLAAVTVPLSSFSTMTLNNGGAPVELNSADAHEDSYAGPGESWWWFPLASAVWDVDDVGLSYTVTLCPGGLPEYELFEFNVTVDEWSFSVGSRGFADNCSLDAAVCGSIDIANITGDLDITQITFEEGGGSGLCRFEVYSPTDITQSEDFIGIWIELEEDGEPLQLLFSAADTHLQTGDYESWEWYAQPLFWNAADETEVRKLWLMHLT